MKYIYIAGPLTSSGYASDNIRKAVWAAEKVISDGHWPFLPHLTHFWHMISPHRVNHETSLWMKMDRAWLEKCDALVRLEGASVGADLEVQWARDDLKPVFSEQQLYDGSMKEALRVMEEMEK